MRTGRRWIVLDADFFANGFTDRLLDRFGPAGICVFVALLCAAKRSRTQGQITYASDAEALELLGIRNLPLTNQAGDKWTLDDLWKFTGTQKQTSRIRHGHVKNLKITHWGLWQKNFQRQEEAARKARSRQGKRPDEFWTAPGTQPGQTNGQKSARDRDVDLDLETPLPPKGAQMASPTSKGKGDFKTLGQAVGELNVQTPQLRGDENEGV